MHLDQLVSLLGPGLVLVVIAAWVVRKLAKAARNERDLEEDRLRGVLAEELSLARARAKESLKRPLEVVAGGAAAPIVPGPAAPIVPGAASLDLRPAAAEPLAGADVSSARPEHLALLAALLAERAEAAAGGQRVQIAWVRSTATHVAWCERRLPVNPAATLVREVICVAQAAGGKLLARSSFG